MVEPRDDLLELFVAAHLSVDEFVFLDRLDLLAEHEVCISEQSCCDHISRINLQSLCQSVDRFLILLLLPQHPAETDPCGQVRGMVRETSAQRLLGLGWLPGLPQLFSELIEKTAFRVGLDPKPELFNLWIRRRLSHRRNREF